VKIQHYVAVLFSYLLFLVMAVVAFSKLSKGMTLLHSGASIWEGRSGIISGLLSLGLAYFLWRWAGSVKENAQVSLRLNKRLKAGQERA